MKKMLLLLLSAAVLSCNGQKKKTDVRQDDRPSKTARAASADTGKVVRSEAEWRQLLTPEQYEVLRLKGTERPFTGAYTEHFEKGTYVCAACGNPLFASGTKFRSDCGWPSFDQALEGSVTYHNDNSFGMQRTEVLCARCGGHLGHVFDDGPEETTGQRFCTNSVSIRFVPAEK